LTARRQTGEISHHEKANGDHHGSKKISLICSQQPRVSAERMRHSILVQNGRASSSAAVKLS
jgi:hypothetical protein